MQLKGNENKDVLVQELDQVISDTRAHLENFIEEIRTLLPGTNHIIRMQHLLNKQHFQRQLDDVKNSQEHDKRRLESEIDELKQYNSQLNSSLTTCSFKNNKPLRI